MPRTGVGRARFPPPEEHRDLARTTAGFCADDRIRLVYFLLEAGFSLLHGTDDARFGRHP